VVKPCSRVARKIVLSEREKNRLVELFRIFLADQEAIQFAYLYGSFLDKLPIHDIDIGVYVQAMTDTDMTYYALELGEQLGRQARCPVDVRVLNGAPVSFVFHVLKGELLCEQNPELHAKVFESTVSRYLDMRPLLLQATREAFGNA
jgi:predicted nucleotidyltransferase